MFKLHKLYKMPCMRIAFSTPSLNGRNILVDILSMLFGLGAWVSVTGFWVELPILIENLPEGWRISSQLSVAIQSANIGPFLWAALPWLKRGRQTGGFSIKTRRCFTYVLLMLGIVSNVLLAFKWDSSVMIAGNIHSIPLIVLMFLVGLIGCTSPVLFMPQMALFPQVHLISYLVGEGLGGFVPSAIALIQGSKHGDIQPQFSPMVYFLIISFLMMLSTISFFLINNLPATRKAMIPQNTLNSGRLDNRDVSHFKESGNSRSEPYFVESVESNAKERNKKTEVDQILPETNCLLLKKKAIKILLIQGWICFFSSGFLPGVSTYASLPHGNEAFHFSSTLGAAVVPIGTSIAFLNKRHPKLATVGAIAAFASILSVYTILSAAYSPNPPLVGTEIGKVLIVLNLVLYAGLSAYVKVNSARICRHIESSLSEQNESTEGNGRGPLFWCGAVSQAAAAAGSLLDLTLVTILGLFKSS